MLIQTTFFFMGMHLTQPPNIGKSPVIPIWKSQKSCNKLPLEPKSGGVLSCGKMV